MGRYSVHSPIKRPLPHARSILKAAYMPTRQLFHHPRTLQRRRLRNLLRLTDILTAVLSGLIALAVTRETFFLTDLGLWLLSALLGWLLSRRPRSAIPLDAYSQVLMAPLLAGGIHLTWTFFVDRAVGPIDAALPAIIWLMGMAVTRLQFRRATPPLLVGLMPGEHDDLPLSDRIQYVSIDEPYLKALDNIEGLVLNPRSPQMQGWFDFFMHVHAAGLPVWTDAMLNEEVTGRATLRYLQTSHMNQVVHVSPYAPYKRLLDIAAVLLFAPMLLLIGGIVALVVLIDSGRPVLFFQERVGQHNRRFRIAKFRTMRTDSERNGAAFATIQDSRVTRVGAVMRKLRLDELPQFWNVLRGDMSIIGPRPEQATFVDKFNGEIHLYKIRHWVKPGITGWAQVMHGYAADATATMDKIRYDVYYIKHFGFWLDASIVAKTLWTIATGFGAR